MINVVVFDQHQNLAFSREIENSLENLQEIVGGHIEAVSPSEFRKIGTHLYVNEEGKFSDDCVPSLYIESINDIVFGNIICSSVNQEGEEIGLTKQKVCEVIALFDELKKIQKRFMGSIAQNTLDLLIDNDCISPMYESYVSVYRTLRGRLSVK